MQNQELIAASGAGDVVRVTSLLNSGADLETVGGKVHASNLIWMSPTTVMWNHYLLI